MKKRKKEKEKRKKMEPGSDNEPDLSVRTSVTNRSLRFNTPIMK